MSGNLLDLLNRWKTRFGPPETAALERLLVSATRRRFNGPEELIRLHETLLFLRAYPRTPEVARLADAVLFGYQERIAAVGADLTAFEEPEISGIAGTSLSAVFSYNVALRLARRYPRNLEIAWDRYDGIDRLGSAVARLTPLAAEEWPVEAHPPFRQWIAAARPRGASDLAWLLARIESLPVGVRERAAIYDALDIPLTWEIGGARASRSRLRLHARKLYCHRAPLLRRADISLPRELEGPALPIQRLPRASGRKMLDLVLDTSAMRYRELYGFSHADGNGVYRASPGRGVEIYFCGVPPQWRLPLRAYHCGMFFKNGVPAGYVELLSFFERAEVGFNLYYTFREGESAWLYAQLLRLFRQTLGVQVFSVDPYQIGHENPEAVASGAFWFYRKLGFRPVDPQIARLVEREESRIEREPGYRSSKRTLEKLAAGYILFESPSAEAGAWDRFRIRNVGLALQRAIAERFGGDQEKFRRWASNRVSRALGMEVWNDLALALSLIPDLERWTREELRAAAKILQAKQGGSETRYLRLMQRHGRLRAGMLGLGTEVTEPSA
ncbi:MAG: hypothetical protein ACLQVN_13980 [Bryobacteraceae bacterium]